MDRFFVILCFGTWPIFATSRDSWNETVRLETGLQWKKRTIFPMNSSTGGFSVLWISEYCKLVDHRHAEGFMADIYSEMKVTDK
jgi:hypothetical protein